MTVNERIKNIRETQKRLLGLTDDDWVELYIKSENLKNSNIGTILYWEKGRKPQVRYLSFLCREFNYNPAFIIGLVETPEFIECPKSLEQRFPETEHMLKVLAMHPTLTMVFRQMVTIKAPELIKDAHLQAFARFPDLYEELKDMCFMFEKYPDLINGRFTK